MLPNRTLGILLWLPCGCAQCCPDLSKCTKCNDSQGWQDAFVTLGQHPLHSLDGVGMAGLTASRHLALQLPEGGEILCNIVQSLDIIFN